MKTLRDILGSDVALDDAAQRLQEAYQSFGRGQASKEDTDLILVDLLQFTRYYGTAQLDESDATVRYMEGRRSVALRIMLMIDAPVALIREFSKAASRG